MKKLVVIVALALSACATQGPPPTAESVLYQTKQGFSVAEKAMRLYVDQPFCGPTVPNPCADRAVVIKLSKAATAANDAIQAADAAVKAGAPNAMALLEAASAAATSLTNQTPKVQP